jgi:DNA-binding CsgD family transcriptional regulator
MSLADPGPGTAGRPKIVFKIALLIPPGAASVPFIGDAQRCKWRPHRFKTADIADMSWKTGEKQEEAVQVDRTPKDIANVLAPMVLAIGAPCFPKALIDALREVANVGHCMVFAFEGEASARCALGLGNIGIGPDLGAAYAEHFYLADPNREMILEHRSAQAPIVLPGFSRRMYTDSYRKLFFEDAEIVDKVAAAFWLERTCFYVNFYRTIDQGKFTRAQAASLAGLVPALTAIVARHCRTEDIAGTTSKLETLFATADRFAVLTPREKQVCLRILSGYGSEAISAELGVSLHSTFTYRKRAYQKLGISSQNELFAIVLGLMALPRRIH